MIEHEVKVWYKWAIVAASGLHELDPRGSRRDFAAIHRNRGSIPMRTTSQRRRAPGPEAEIITALGAG